MAFSGDSKLVQASNPKTELITVYDEKDQVKVMTPKEVGEKFSFTFMHGILYNQVNICDALLKLDEASSTFSVQQSAVIKYLKNPINYLDLMFVSSDSGYSTIAKEDIPADTFIGIYSGSDDYSYTSREYALDMGWLNIITAKNYGDITRFMPHLPGCIHSAIWATPFDAKTIELTYHKKSTDKSIDIEYANIKLENINFPNNIKCPAFWTTRAIKKGGFVGWDYSLRYWGIHNIYQIYLKPENGLNNAKHQVADRKIYYPCSGYGARFEVTDRKLELVGHPVQPLAGNPCTLYQPKVSLVIEADFKVNKNAVLDMKHFFNNESARLNVKR